MTIRAIPNKQYTNITYRQALKLGIRSGTTYWSPDLRKYLIICTPYGEEIINLTHVILEVEVDLALYKQHMYLMQGRVPRKDKRLNTYRVIHINEDRAYRVNSFAVYNSI